jgi:hypothetical protein
MDIELAAAEIKSGLEDREADRVAGRALGRGALHPAAELGAARRTVEAKARVKRRIILVGDENFRDIPL